MAGTVHHLKMTLRQVKPPVWRRIVVRSDLTLGELSPVLEAAMGWMGGHMHVFEVGHTAYGMLDSDWPAGDLDENQFRLSDVLPGIGMNMRWDYDFGDGWEHDVVVEDVGEPDQGAEYPVCLEGRRACLPEDCGGPWGYADLLKALRRPGHPNRDELRQSVPFGFDPARFDEGEATRAMRSPRLLDGLM